jgi:multimeric flavodoxin WrbA
LEIVVLNGARTQDAKVDYVGQALKSTLNSLGNVQVFQLRDTKVADCIGCFGCWIKTPGTCVIDDAAISIAQKLMHADVTVFLTPIVFGGYSYELKKVLDRQICRELPFFRPVKGEIHHKPRYDRHSKLVAVGFLPTPNRDSEEVFRSLVSRNAINMHAPVYSVGVVYDSEPPEVVAQKISQLLSETEVKA